MSQTPQLRPRRSRNYAKRNKRFGRVGIFLLMALVLMVMLFPFYWMILTSFRTQLANTSATPVWFFRPTLDNYVNVVRGNDFLAFT